MLTVTELLALIDASVSPRPAAPAPLTAARGLLLAEPLIAISDQPAFDRSAMDGFAVDIDAPAGSFAIIGESLPGHSAPPRPGRNEALRIFTGSALPPGVKVVMQEHATESAGHITVASMAHSGHVRRRGSAIKSGDTLLDRHLPLTPAALAILAGEGITNPKVIPAPRVAHLTTGSEIIAPDSQPLPGQIRNTNAPLMRALIEEAGAIYTAHHHVDESLDSALAICQQPTFSDADILLVSGGASVGKHDRTALLLETLGFRLICQKVNCRPGKPLLLGVRGHQVAVGLPGNPVSHFVAFHLFVRRILRLMAGLPAGPWQRATLSPASPLAASDRETYWPAQWHISPAGLTVFPRPWLDSGDLASLARIDALIRLPANASLPSAGDVVEFIPCGGLPSDS